MAFSNWEMSELNHRSQDDNRPPMAGRFRGYLPVVIDIETAGFNPKTDAILEIGATFLDMDKKGTLTLCDTLAFDVEPFPGANLEPAALEFNGINPDDPARAAQNENDVLHEFFRRVRDELKFHQCKRAIVVAHNASFDHQFLNAAVERCAIKRNPFHPFSSMDTATLAGVAYGHTVLAHACQIARIPFDNKSAHTARYDAEVTAKLFCQIVNQWRDMGGWAWATSSRHANGV